MAAHDADLDTLLAALYEFVDDYLLPAERRRSGRPKRNTDAELVCLAVAEVMLDCPAQTLAGFRYALGWMFPYLHEQPGLRQRINGAGTVLDIDLYTLAARSRSTREFRFIDRRRCPAAPTWPLDKLRPGRRANYGYRASHSRGTGSKLYLVTTAHGMPVTCCLADPKLGERDVALD